jgi:chlorobactene glucosyltransferase
VVLALALLPWILLGLYLFVGVREPRPLPPVDAGPWPFVSVVVPARNEARNIGPCLETLGGQAYPGFEILVVDDRSEDGTGALARGRSAGRARELRVVEGAPLPEGWFGKPWACHQGAAAARGDLLLFTDADTRHAPDLLERAVSALREDRAAAVTLVGDQEMGTFFERLLQPQIFAVMAMRFGNLERPVPPRRWRAAIANGQFILIRRGAYDAIGGHEVVRSEVVEDLRLAQELVRAGHVLSLRLARGLLSTRMYTSFRELADGWTKNLAVGAWQAAGRLGPVIVPAALVGTFLLWLLPPGVLILAGAGTAAGYQPLHVPTTVLLWAGGASLLSAATWAGAYRRFGTSPLFGLIYPMGTVLVSLIILRSWVRGTRRIDWKGRRYVHGRAR